MLHFLSGAIPLSGVIEKDYAGRGIYVIFCEENCRCYVGSSINGTHRLLSHRHKLRKNTHPNRHLQRAYSAYGEDAFVVKLIQDMPGSSREELLAAEKFWMDSLGSVSSGFNQRINPSSNEGIPTKAETRKKLSDAVKRYYELHPEARERARQQGLANKGKYLVSWIAKNGSYNKGRKENPVVTAKRAAALRARNSGGKS